MPILPCFMELMAIPMLVLAMLDMAMVLAMLDMLDTPMPSTARGLLMLSPRLMPTMVFMDMDMLLPTPMVPMPMVATPMPTDGASKMSSASV